MRRQVGEKVIGVFLAMVLVLTACTGGGQKNEPIKLGYIGALSGLNKVLGEWDTYGIKLVLDEVNAQGGVCGGRQLQLIEYDDQADTAKAMDAAQKLINDDKAVLVFATTNSNTSLAVLPLLTEAKIPQVTGGLSVDLTKQGSAYIFRKVGAGNVFESTLVDYLVQQRGFKSFAIISDSSAYGTGQADYEQAALRRNNLESVAREAYEPNATDFKEQLSRIIALKPEVLLLGGSEVASGLIAKQARELGFTGQIAGGAATGTPKFIEMAGNEAAEGVIFASPYVDNNLNDETRDFAARYQAKWGSEPENHGAKAYDGAMLAVEAIKRSCDNLTGEEIARQLHGIQNYQGLQGVFNFQENGEGIAVAQLGIIHDGKLTPLK